MKIASVEELEIFGEKVQSKIRTYVNKILLSKLSGNIVDLCLIGIINFKIYQKI